ncbi:hypothetical protein FOZ63_002024, partial [Perkinsus olseni]
MSMYHLPVSRLLLLPLDINRVHKGSTQIVENLPGEPDAAGSPDHLNDALESGPSQGGDGSGPDAQPTSMHRERTVRLNGGSNEDLRGNEEPQGIEVATDNNIVPRRLAARQPTLQYVAIVLVDKHNTAYRISVFLLL